MCSATSYSYPFPTYLFGRRPKHESRLMIIVGALDSIHVHCGRDMMSAHHFCENDSLTNFFTGQKHVGNYYKYCTDVAYSSSTSYPYMGGYVAPGASGGLCFPEMMEVISTACFLSEISGISRFSAKEWIWMESYT